MTSSEGKVNMILDFLFLSKIAAVLAINLPSLYNETGIVANLPVVVKLTERSLVVGFTLAIPCCHNFRALIQPKKFGYFQEYQILE